jgi:hypothetical protein
LDCREEMKDAMENWAGPDGDSRTDYSALEHWEQHGYKEAWASFLAHCDQELRGNKARLYVPYLLVLKKHGGADFLSASGGQSRSYPQELNIYAPWVKLAEIVSSPQVSRASLKHWEERGYKEAWMCFLAHCDQELKGKAPLYVPYRLTVKSRRGMELLLRERHGSYSSYHSSYLNLYAPWVELHEATGLPKGPSSPGGDASDTKRGRTSQRRA